MPKKSRIAAAVGISINALDKARGPLVKRVELAMSEAVTQASFDGVADPAEVKARMMAARAEVLSARG